MKIPQFKISVLLLAMLLFSGCQPTPFTQVHIHLDMDVVSITPFATQTSLSLPIVVPIGALSLPTAAGKDPAPISEYR